jgi:hypothetical protein
LTHEAGALKPISELPSTGLSDDQLRQALKKYAPSLRAIQKSHLTLFNLTGSYLKLSNLTLADLILCNL